MSQPMFTFLLLGFVLVTSIHGLAAGEIPQLAGQRHLGVASCAAGVCHGSVQSRSASAVQQNEYVVWSLRDRHRIAYKTLLTPAAKIIANKLGLANAHESVLCLDCHADNVEDALRGKRFQIDDGVGCEACHGGAGLYIASHADPTTPRPDNLDAGMYPTDDPRARARLCLSCHQGTAQKMASHDIMGAGHPRLSFELDTFGVLQPAHYVVDEDYRQVKWTGSSIDVWAIGQAESARQTLVLIRDRISVGGLLPELALFDCHACHHPMSDQRWQASDRARLPPGSVRLNDASFVMLIAIAGVLKPELELQLREGLQHLHQTVVSGALFEDAIATLMLLIDEFDRQFELVELSARTPALVAALIETASEGKLNDYVVAEQVVMALDMLLSASGQRDANAQWLDAVYLSVAAEHSFDASVFVQQMRGYAKGAN